MEMNMMAVSVNGANPNPSVYPFYSMSVMMHHHWMKVIVQRRVVFGINCLRHVMI